MKEKKEKIEEKQKKKTCSDCPNGVCEEKPTKSKITKKFGLRESAQILME